MLLQSNAHMQNREAKTAPSEDLRAIVSSLQMSVKCVVFNPSSPTPDHSGLTKSLNTGRMHEPKRCFPIGRSMKIITFCVFSASVVIFMAVANQVCAMQAESTSTTQGSQPKSDDEDPSWITFTPTGARSSFDMPKKPRFVARSFSPVKNEPPIKVRLHLATFNDGKSTLVFGYHDLHEIPRSRKKVNDALDGAVRGSVANVMGQLLTNPTEIKYKHHPGRQFIYVCAQEKTKYVVTARVLMVGKRQYQLSCLMEEEVYDKSIAERFLDSFRLIQPKNDLPPRPRISQ